MLGLGAYLALLVGTRMVVGRTGLDSEAAVYHFAFLLVIFLIGTRLRCSTIQAQVVHKNDRASS